MGIGALCENFVPKILCQLEERLIDLHNKNAKVAQLKNILLVEDRKGEYYFFHGEEEFKVHVHATKF